MATARGAEFTTTMPAIFHGICLGDSREHADTSEYPVKGTLGLDGRRLPELDLIPISVIDPGKAAVRFIHSFGVNFYSFLL